MNRSLLLVGFFLIFPCFKGGAQSKYQTIAQFKLATEHLKNDTNKVLRIANFAHIHGVDSPGAVQPIIDEGMMISAKLNYKRGIEQLMLVQGELAEAGKNYPTAIHFYINAASIAQQLKQAKDTYLCYNSLLNLYYYQADHPGAILVAQKGLALAIKSHNLEYQAFYNNQLAFISLKQEKSDESIQFSDRYLLLANELHNRMMEADAYNISADAYLLKREYQTSLDSYFKALAIYRSMNLTEKMIGAQIVSKNDRLLNTSYRISVAYRQMDQYKLALKYSLSETELNHLQNANQYDLASYYTNLGEIYSGLKQYKRAGRLIKHGIVISKTILHREDTRDAFEALSENYARQKRFDGAYQYYVLFTQLRDEIHNEKVNRQISNLELAERDKQILLLRQHQEIKTREMEKEQLNRSLIVGFITLLAVTVAVFLYVQLQKRHQKHAFEKKLAVQTERQRISSDMHDDIGTGLSTMLIYVNMLKLKLANGEHESNIDRIAAIGTSLIDQMKEIVWSLHPGNDRLDSLLLYIRQYSAALFEPLPCDIQIFLLANIPAIQVESQVRRNIFLCVKEALNNIIKHADATCTELHIMPVKDTLIIKIKDNGHGLSASPEKEIGNGLRNIRNRMAAIGGKAAIYNSNGAVIELEVDLSPYPKG